MNRNISLLRPPVATMQPGSDLAAEGRQRPYPASCGGPRPSLTLAYLAALAGQAGHEVTALDGAWQQLTLEETLQPLPASQADCLVVEFAAEHLLESAFMQWLRPRYAGPIVAVGPAVQARPAELFAQGVDVLLAGEPEAAFIDWLSGNGSWEGLNGVVTRAAFRKGGAVAPRYVTDLDELPFPAWSALGVTSNPFSLESTRGCIHACLFCPYFSSRKVFRARTLASVMRELEWLINDFGMAHLIFADPVFALDRARARALCSQIIQRGLRFTWECESRPEHFDTDLLPLMKAAGCTQITLGVGTLDPELLVRLRRVGDTTEAELYRQYVKEVVALAQAVGLNARVVVMTDLPKQTETMAQTTLEQLRSVGATEIVTQPFARLTDAGPARRNPKAA